MAPRIVYVAGPFRGPSAWAIEQNIRRAEALALEVWRSGAVALCPHTNTRFFQGALPDDVWLSGDLVLLERCDALLLTPDWESSGGATIERIHAERRGLPIFETIAALQAWLETGA
jgi:hypothetical protein